MYLFKDTREMIEKKCGNNIDLDITINCECESIDFFFYNNTITKKLIGHFTLSDFPNCCGICVCGDFRSVRSKYTKFLMDMIKFIAKEMKFSCITGTIVNSDMQSLLFKNGYTKVWQFKNKKTGNTVKMYTMNI